MKIAFLSFYSGLVDRGVETFVDALATRLTDNHEVLVIQGGRATNSKTYQVRQIPMKHCNTDGISVGWQRNWLIDSMSKKIGKFTYLSLPILDAFKPDIIIPTNGGWQSLLIKLYCLKNRNKMVISGQAGLGRDERWNLLLKPDLYVALTQRNYEWVKQYAPNQKIAVIPNGVDLKTFSSHQSGKGVDSVKSLPHPQILCVAGPESYKRVAATIEAVSLVPEASLIVAGGSEETKEKGRQMLGERFIQLKVAHDLMPQLYAEADLFTLVSEPYEAFGISYLEAMASNLPVVVPDDTLRREIVGEAGMYVADSLDAKDYAEKIQQALQKKWGNIPRKQAEKYDWDVISLNYEQIFNHFRALP